MLVGHADDGRVERLSNVAENLGAQQSVGFTDASAHQHTVDRMFEPPFRYRYKKLGRVGVGFAGRVDTPHDFYGVGKA